MAYKLLENISDPSQSTPVDFKTILNEENLSMQKKIYKDIVVEKTRNLNFELTAIFKTALGDSALSGGYMEITIINPDGHIFVEEINQIGGVQKYIFPRSPVPGSWTIELQGFGFQSPASVIYSCGYELTVPSSSETDPESEILPLRISPSSGDEIVTTGILFGIISSFSLIGIDQRPA